MISEKKILTLVDGSERSIQTASYIKDFMPMDQNTRIVLFHVFSSVPEEFRDADPACADAIHDLKKLENQNEKNIRKHLEQVKRILVEGGISDQLIDIKFHPLQNGVARDIIEEAKNGYSAVIMRRRGRGVLKSIILGSVAVKLLQSLTFIPIIIVGQASPVKKILLAVDSSPSSMKAVEFAESMLAGHRYEICIFHAIPGLGSVKFDCFDMSHPELPELKIAESCIETFKSRISQLFHTIKDRLIQSGFAPETVSEKIVTGVYSRSDAIIREAENGGYSTIIVGRRGLSKVEAFFMGRVGHEVVYGGKQFSVWVV